MLAIVLAAGSNGLGAVWSLASAGVDSVVVGDKREIALRSRLPIEKVVIPQSEDPRQALIDTLERLTVPSGSPIIPTSDYFVSAVRSHSEQLNKRFTLCIPPADLAERIIDKAQEHHLISEAGIAVPRSLAEMPATKREVLSTLKLPIIVKPRSFRYVHLLEGKKNVIIRSEQELDQLCRRLGETCRGLIGQELIPGDDNELWVCNCTFNHEHKLAGVFTFQRHGLAPAHFGVTSLAMSKVNPEIIGTVARLGKSLKYTGPAMVEFKRDARDGIYKYIELNPRLGMCNWFDTSCGVNNVWLSYRLARGEALPEAVPSQREGIVYWNLFEDVYSRYKDGQSFSTIVKRYLKLLWKHRVGAYLRWSDPRPGFSMAAFHIRESVAAILGMRQRA